MDINQTPNQPVENNAFGTVEEKEFTEQRPANPEPEPETTQASDRMDDGCACKTDKHKKCCCNTCLLACNIVLLLGLIVLYILHFTGTGIPSKHNPDATEPVIAEDGVLKVACVDSDTLLAKYQYAIDLQAELNAYKDAQEKSYQQQMTQFQKDYQNFIQTGDKMTLSQQEAKEAELKARAEKLGTLEAELTSKVMEKQMNSNIELLNRIFAFVREYNKDNQQFDIILRKTFNDSPTLYMNPAMDITDEIVEGLNNEYKSVKAKRSK